MATKSDSIDIITIHTGILDAFIVGESPLILNAMSAKASQELLLPAGRKTAAARAATIKHEPYSEFIDSMTRPRDPESPTRIVVKATAFKRAMMGAAVDLPGATKAQIGRLCFVEGDEVPIYGVPEMLMAITRSLDSHRTPDVRTRAIVPQWAARIQVRYTMPMTNAKGVANLLAAAGVLQGIGDWRPEKGSGNYGQFRIAEPDDPQLRLLMTAGARAAQDEAIASPGYYDDETVRLAQWFDAEVARRGIEDKVQARRKLSAA